MNVICILCDTLTREKLGPYQRSDGPYAHIRTPNLDRFAAHAVRFDNHWMNSAPCMPARRDLFSGRIEFPWRSWGPRESFDPDWTLTLREESVETALFSDHANLFDVGAGNYHHFFDTYRFVRGHFNDHFELQADVQPGRAGLARQLYLAAQRHLTGPEESFVARNLRNVETWIDARGARPAADGSGDSPSSGRAGTGGSEPPPFFLFVDEFDPHWPLDPPEPYRSMYVDDPAELERDHEPFYTGKAASDYTARDLAWLNAQYAGKVTMVDHYLGRLFDCIGRNGLWDDTMVIVTTDHGEYIGEYGQVSKGFGPSYPLFARLPLLVHCPGSPLAGGATAALSCAVDLHATVLDALGASVSPACHGRSLLPVLAGATGEAAGASGTGASKPSGVATNGLPGASSVTVRDDVIYGWWGKGFYWTDGRHLLCKAPEHPGPLYQYGTDLGEKYVGLKSAYFDRYAGAQTGAFLPHTDRPVYRVPSNGMAYSAPDADCDLLFDLVRDPECRENLYDREPGLRRRAIERLAGEMRRLEVPPEHFQRLAIPFNCH